MRLLDGEATRAHGTLQIELADGRTATLEVDLNLTAPDAAYGIDHEYVETDGSSYMRFFEPLPVRTKFSVTVGRDQPDPIFELVVPTIEGGA